MLTAFLPQIFGVVRTQSLRGPCVQLCTSRYIQEGQVGHDYFIVRNAGTNDIRSIDLDIHLVTRNIERQIHRLRYKHPESGQIQEVYFWFLPFQMNRGHQAIPLLDFQYRSWLPTSYIPVPFQFDPQQAMRMIEVIQQEKLEEIRRLEDLEAEGHQYSSYLSRTRRFEQDEDMDYERMNMFDPRASGRRSRLLSEPRTPSPPREVRVVEVQVPVERVVIQTRVQALPKAVGDILLANARQGEETCPIAAIPLKECEKICVTSCFHIFDTQNLERWRENHTTCPVCRTKIENVVSE